jgi:polyferredoxin
LWKTVLRPRTIIYFTVWVSIGLAMLFALGGRTRIDISAQQDRNPIYVRLSDGEIRNSYTVKVRNMEARPRKVEITLDGLAGAKAWSIDGSRETASRVAKLDVPADSVAKLKLFVAAPGAGAAQEDFSFKVRSLDEEHETASAESRFERPEAGQ